MSRLDEASFGEFYRTMSRGLWAYVYRVTGNAADADDIVQDAFCRLLRTAPRNEDEWRRYLYRVASNLVVDRWRRRERERRHERETPDSGLPPPGSPRSPAGPGSPGSPGSNDEDVARTFAELSPRERALLWLAYVEEESHEHIATSLGLGRRSIKVLLFRARRKLRDLLTSKGLVPGA